MSTWTSCVLIGVSAMITVANTTKQATHTMTQNQECEDVAMVVPARSAVDCMTTCNEVNKGSSLCYAPLIKLCTCCIADGTPGDGNSKCYDSKDSGICPSGWTYVDTTCFSYPSSENVDYSTCKSMCDTAGGNILTIQSADQKSTVQAFIENNPVVPAGPLLCWLGMYGVSDNVTLTWFHSETDMPVVFFDWAADEPNAIYEACVAMGTHGSFRYKWVNIICDFIAPCICQL